MSQYAELLAQLDAASDEQSTMAKSMAAAEEDDAKVAAAAEDAGVETNPEDKDDDDDDKGADGADGEGEGLFAKSMVIDGEEVQVVDAEAMVKALNDLSGRVGESEGVLAKAVPQLLQMVTAQADMIKSLSGRLDALAKTGAGRKTVLAIHEKPAPDGAMAKSEGAQLTVGEVMAKANANFAAGKLTGLELTTLDVTLRSGQAVEPQLLAKALV